MINVEFKEIPIQGKEQCASENTPSVNICEVVSVA